jgi:hypothetical protein
VAKLRTLRDAGVYILALPPAEAEREHWQIAMEFLISAAEKGGIVMMAHIARRLCRALRFVHQAFDRNRGERVSVPISTHTADVYSTPSRISRLTASSPSSIASSHGILPATIDNTLSDAFGQRIVSTMLTQQNQYHVVLEVQPQFQFGPNALRDIYVNSSSGQQVPLSTLVNAVEKVAPLVVNHQGQFPSVTVSFNLLPGVAIGNAVAVIQQADLGEQVAGANRLAFGERDPRELSLDLAADDIGVIRDHRADTAQVNRHVLAAHLAGDDRYRRWRAERRRSCCRRTDARRCHLGGAKRHSGHAD